MSNFEWTSPLTAEEKGALRGYKDDTWLKINPGLRSGSVPDAIKEHVRLLDNAIFKGRCTEAVTLFRATGNSFLSIEGNVMKPDKAHLSTSLRDEGLGQFFESENPVKIIFQCPLHTNMAAFEHDDAGGEEEERLLPRETAFRIISQRTVPNRLNINEPEGPFNRYYMQLAGKPTILIYTVEPM